jgi:acetylornithine deacetylase/succinyl-diaminopimelate desuccinylase-like protein
MSRSNAIEQAQAQFDSGAFRDLLARRVAIPTESQNPARQSELVNYLDAEIRPAFEAMGFTCQTLTHARAQAPFLFAQRIEDAAAPTVFGYGHGDVIRGQESGWREGLSPWTLTERGGRWYGRGIADNKGQHSINMQAMANVMKMRGRLGFNAKYLIEMGEEVVSPGLRELCALNKDLFAADVMLASDGPRLSAERPTVFLGSRGCINFDLAIEARDGAHHSGNWGGLISNPGIQLAHAIAGIVSPSGQIRISGWVPKALPDPVRRALADCEVDGGADGPSIEPGWGEPGLSPAERVFGWSSFEVLFRRVPGRAASCALWSASIPMRSCRPCARIWTARALPWSASPRRATKCFQRRASIRTTPGCNGSWLR